MKQKRIPANSIIVPLVVVAVVLSALLSFAGFVNAGVIEGGRLVYGIIGMAIICLLGAIAIFAAVIYQRKEACRTMEYAFNAPMKHDEQSLDFTRIETPKEFVTGVFATTTVVERVTENLDEVRARNQRKLDQETEEIIRQLRNSEFFIGSLGHQPEESSCPQTDASMEFTIDMVSQVLVALQQAQAQSQRVQQERNDIAAQALRNTSSKGGSYQTQLGNEYGKTPEFVVTVPEFPEETMPCFTVTAEEFPVTVPEFPVMPPQCFEAASPAQVEKSEYHGAHFKSDVEFLFDSEPLFTILPKMKHARKVQSQKVEKAG